jgi:D-alanine-D-alanine ligase
MSHKLKVGVLRGGPSSEYDVSLQTGAAVIKHLPERYQAIDVFIDKSGVWHLSGMPILPHRALSKVDVVFNALHGEYGEDGKVQHILETFGVPYTGPKTFPAAISMSKPASKKLFVEYGLKTPRSVVLDKTADLDALALQIVRTLHLPVVIKPAAAGSSVGVSIVKRFHDFVLALKKAFVVGRQVLAEEMVSGKEATCGVLENYRNRRHYALLPVEIIHPKDKDFFDYEAKYGGSTGEVCPGNFSQGQKREIERMAISAHQALGLRHYSRSDFIIHPTRGVFILETNSLPGLTAESLYPKSLMAVGSSLPEFLDHVLTCAISRQ